LSATLVGLIALFVVGVATVVLDSESFVTPLVVGVAFIGIATVVLVPRTKSRTHEKHPESAVRL
jgi:positive regulator of sigma E activity